MVRTALRDDEYVTRLHFDIGRKVATLHQIFQTNPVLSVIFGGAQDRCTVAVGKIGNAADSDHHVKDGHFWLVGKSLGFGRFANNADLLAVGADEARNNHRDHWVANELGQLFLHVTG